MPAKSRARSAGVGSAIEAPKSAVWGEADGVRVEGDYLGGASVAGHGAGGESERAGTHHDDTLSVEVAGVAEDGGHGGSGAVRWGGDFVGDVGGYGEDGRAGGEVAVLSVGTRKVLPLAERVMAEFKAALALGGQAKTAEGTVATTPDH